MATHDVPIGARPSRACAAQRALARDFPPGGRELSGDRRAGRLAQSVAHHSDDVVAGFGAQRDVGSGTGRPGLCAAYFGGPAADREGAALLRRCADADRRSHRKRSQRHRGAGRRLRPGKIGRDGADRSLRAAVRPHPRRRRRADGEIQRAAQACRVRAARAGTGFGRAGRRGRPGREPRAQRAGGLADLGADRGLEFPQRPYPRHDASPRRGASSSGR